MGDISVLTQTIGFYDRFAWALKIVNCADSIVQPFKTFDTSLSIVNGRQYTFFVN